MSESDNFRGIISCTCGEMLDAGKTFDRLAIVNYFVLHLSVVCLHAYIIRTLIKMILAINCVFFRPGLCLTILMP